MFKVFITSHSDDIAIVSSKSSHIRCSTLFSSRIIWLWIKFSLSSSEPGNPGALSSEVYKSNLQRTW